jgi:hypothetical protein
VDGLIRTVVRRHASMKRLTGILCALLLLSVVYSRAQVNTALAPVPKFQFISANGVPLAGGCLFSFVTGTNTPLATYTDANGFTLNSNPVILDASGSANVWLGPQKYRLRLVSAGGVNCSTGSQLWQVDGVAGNNLVFQGTASPINLNGCPHVNANQSFATALAAATTPGCLVVDPGTYTVGTAVIPSNVSLVSMSGGILSVSGSLTINGPIVAPALQIFSGAGTVRLGTQISQASVEWWGNGDLGAQINAASAALAGPGQIWIAGGTSWTTAVTLLAGQTIQATHPLTLAANCGSSPCLTFNFPSNNFYSPSSSFVTVNYAGSGAFMLIEMVPTNSSQAGTVHGMTVNCSGCTGTNTTGIHIADVVGLTLEDLHIAGFTGTGGTCLWSDNVNAWTERDVERAVWLDNCTKLHRWTNTGNTQLTSSFGHWPFIEERWNLAGNQTGWSIEGGDLYDEGFISITGNAVGASANTLFAVSGSQYSSGPATAVSSQAWNVQVEQTSGTASHQFNIAANTAMTGCGYFAPGGLDLGTVTGTISISGPCPSMNNTSLSFFNSSGTLDSILAMGSANITVLRGDPSVAQIYIQANGANNDLVIGTTAVALQTGRSLNLSSSGLVAGGKMLITTTAPTITGHFNTSGDSISSNNGPSAFEVTVGTGAAGSIGTVGLPAATTSWNCNARNLNRGAYIQQTGARSTNSATFTNYGTTIGTPVNWTNSDVISISCFAY